MIKPSGIVRRGSLFDLDHSIVFSEKKIGQMDIILPGYAGDKGFF
jgi:hypothetical protein